MLLNIWFGVIDDPMSADMQKHANRYTQAGRDANVTPELSGLRSDLLFNIFGYSYSVLLLHRKNL